MVSRAFLASKPKIETLKRQETKTKNTKHLKLQVTSVCEGTLVDASSLWWKLFVEKARFVMLRALDLTLGK